MRRIASLFVLLAFAGCASAPIRHLYVIDERDQVVFYARIRAIDLEVATEVVAENVDERLHVSLTDAGGRFRQLRLAAGQRITVSDRRIDDPSKGRNR